MREIAEAADLDQLQAAQAALLPLLGLSLEETAIALGRSKWWTTRARNQFIRGESPARHGGRRNELVDEDAELQLVRDAIQQPGTPYGKKLPLRAALRLRLDAHATSPVSESTISRMLDRVAPRMIAGAVGRHLNDRVTVDALIHIWRDEDERRRRDQNPWRKKIVAP